VGHSKFGIAIVGLGLISKTHADAYKRLPDLVGEVVGCDIDPGARERFASEFQCRTLTDLQQVIADPNIDIVDLILPHHLHYEAAMAVLDAGKHLIIEKPVAGTYREALAICDRSRDVGVHFMVAENTRYIAAYVAVEKLLRSGVIGEVVHARTFLRSNEKDHLSQQGYWRTKYAMGGGLVMDTGAHSFYLLKWLLGDFDNVVGTSTKVFPLDNEIEDTAEVQGRLKSGAHFSCGFTSVSEIPHSERLELYGTRGGIVVDQMAEPVVKLFGGHQDFKGVPIDGVAFGPDAWHPGGWHYESVITEVTDYVQSLAEGRAPLIDSYDCAYAMRVVEAAYASIGSSKPVSLPEFTVAGR
jgi:UDP-N-acetyl-2-amino-2-deoxyglucuronate dehydrogenase